MASSTDRGQGPIPWPGAWDSFEWRGVVLRVGLGITVLAFGLAGMMVFTSHDPRGPFVLAGMATFLLFFPHALLAQVAPKNRGLRNVTTFDVGVPVVLVSWSRPLAVAQWFAALAGAVFTASLPFLASGFSSTGSSWWDYKLAWLIFVGPVAAGALTIYLLVRLIRWRKPLGVALSPEGIHVFAWFGVGFFAWDEIKDVVATSRGGLIVDLQLDPNSPASDGYGDSWICRLDYVRERLRQINAGYLAINPALLYYALRFYHANPEVRDELADDTGLNRLRKADFPALRDNQ